MKLELFDLSKLVFSKTSEITNYFILPLFLVRIISINIGGSSRSDYGTVIRGAIYYFALIYSFEYVLSILFCLSESLAPEIQKISLNAKTDSAAYAEIPSVLLWSLEAIVSCLYALAEILNIALIIVLSSIAPIVFLLSCILGIGFGAGTFFGLLISVSSWPIVFSACSYLTQTTSLVSGGSSLKELMLDLFIGLLKLAGPISLGLAGMHSSAGQALQKSFGIGMSSAQSVGFHALYFRSGMKGHEFSSQGKSARDVLRRETSFVTQRISHRMGEKLQSHSTRMKNRRRNSNGRYEKENEDN